jgi:hypothetical protein
MARQQQQSRIPCWYCGGGPLSKEDILGRQLTPLFRGHGQIRHRYEGPEGVTARSDKLADRFALQTRKFCKTCNESWMAGIDNRVKPLLACFAQDRPVVMGSQDQRDIAAWITKTVLGVLSKEPDEYRFADDELYRTFGQVHAPLPNTQIWLGANAHGDMAWFRAHSLRLDSDHVNGFGMSLSFGYAVAHFCNLGNTGQRLRLFDELQPALKPLWPNQVRLAWPPRKRFADIDLTSLALDSSQASTLEVA